MKVGVTKYRAWRQNLSETLRRGKGGSPRALYQNRQNPSDEICLGNYFIYSLIKNVTFQKSMFVVLFPKQISSVRVLAVLVESPW